MEKYSFVMITGASSGIGFQLARLFAAKGKNLVLVSSNPAKLDNAAQIIRSEFPKVLIESYPCNLALPDDRKKLISKLETDNRPISILVNNAGIGLHGAFRDNPEEKILELLQLNMLAPVELTRWLFSQKYISPDTSVINIASMAAFQPGPYMAAYYASKAFMHSFFNAVKIEEPGIHILTVYPGPVHTGFLKRARMKGSHAFNLFAMSAERVAQKIFRAYTSGKSRLVPGIRNKLLYFLSWILPEGLIAAIVAGYQRGKKKGA